MEEDSLDSVYLNAVHNNVCDSCADLDTREYEELTKANLAAHTQASLDAAGPVNDVCGHADKKSAWLEKKFPIVRQEPAQGQPYDCSISAGGITRIAESELSHRAEEVKIDRNKMRDPVVAVASKTLFTRELSFKGRDRQFEDTRKASVDDDALWVLIRNHLPKDAHIDQSTIRTTGFRRGEVVFDAERAVSPPL